MSVNIVRDTDGDYEIVDLPDGTQIRREHLTKAQLRIKALKERNRHKQMNDDLLSYAAEIRQKCSNIASEKSARESQSAISRQLKTNDSSEKIDLKSYLLAVRDKTPAVNDEASAIEKQKRALAEKAESQSVSPGSKKQGKLKWPALKSIGRKLKPQSGSYLKFRPGNVA